MIFLDWEKAFDKIDHDKMFQALQRLNIPKEMIDMIKGDVHKTAFQGPAAGPSKPLERAENRHKTRLPIEPLPVHFNNACHVL